VARDEGLGVLLVPLSHLLDRLDFQVAFPFYGRRYLAFLTSWGYTLIQLYFLVTAVLTGRELLRPGGTESQWLRWKCLGALLLELALAFEVPIILFWSVLYPLFSESAVAHWNFWWKNLNFHGVACVALLSEFLFLSRTPFTFDHFWIFMAMALVYAVVNCAVTLGSYPVYPPVTWKDARTPMLFLVAFLLGLSTWFVCLRIRRCQRRQALIKSSITNQVAASEVNMQTSLRPPLQEA